MQISVVIPLYNKKSSVLRAIQSVTLQEYAGKPMELEVVVVDDASTDGSDLIVEQYPDSIVRLVRHDNNQGVSAARNTGISASRGEWIAFLDADDVWKPGVLSRVFSIVQENASAQCIFWLAEEQFLSEIKNQTIIKSAPNSGFVNYYSFAVRTGIEMNSSSLIVRKRLIQDVGCFPVGIKLGEDTDTWLRIASKTQIFFANFIGTWVDASSSGRKAVETVEEYPFWLRFFHQQRRSPNMESLGIRDFTTYHANFVLDRSFKLARSGRRARALYLLKEIDTVRGLETKLLKCLIVLLLPLWVLEMIPFSRLRRLISTLK